MNVDYFNSHPFATALSVPVWLLLSGVLSVSVAVATPTQPVGPSAARLDPPNPTKADPGLTSNAESQEEAKPRVRSWTSIKEGHAFTLTFTPGIPDRKQLTEIMIAASSLPKTPHPEYGSRVPLKGAKIYLRIESPKGKNLGRYVAHPMPLAEGRYGVHFTPMEEGIHRVVLEGATPDDTALAAEFALPVAVWPLPKALQGEGDARSPHVGRRVLQKASSTP